MPLGTPANPPLRKLRSQTHAEFDPLWRGGFRAKKVMSRTECYAWLASQLGIHPDLCHVALFTVELCVAAIQAVRKFKRERERHDSAGPV
jgi:hypothetical protein